MFDEHPVLAVYGNKVFWLDQRKHHLLLFLAGVPGDMQIGMPVINDLGALVEKLVDHAADGVLIAGDGGGDDAVSRIDLYLLMLGESHAVEGRHALTLAAR